MNYPNSLSFSVWERCSSPLTIFIALLWTHSNRSMPFLCWGSRTGCRTPGGVSQEQNRAGEWRPLTCCLFLRTGDIISFLGWKIPLLAHVQFFTHQYFKILLCRASLHPLISQPVLIQVIV